MSYDEKCNRKEEEKGDILHKLQNRGWYCGYFTKPEDYKPIECSDGILTGAEQSEAFNKGVDERYEYDADQSGDD